jgi:hypothetical protein
MCVSCVLAFDISSSFVLGPSDQHTPLLYRLALELPPGPMAEGDVTPPGTSESPSKPRKMSRVSFSKETLQVLPPPNPTAETYVGKYITSEATWRVLRHLSFGLAHDRTSEHFGRTSSWASGGDNSRAWLLCCPCFGTCLISQQRADMETKLSRWHRERGNVVEVETVSGKGVPCSMVNCCICCLPCCRAYLVAEHVGALHNFKTFQNLGGWPIGTIREAPGAAPKAQEMQRDANVMGV